MAHFDTFGPQCTAQPMYVLKPTCSYCRKWCRSDDDAHTNTGRGSPLRSNGARPRLVSTMQLWWTAALPCNFFFSKPSLGLFRNFFPPKKNLPSLQGLGRSQHWIIVFSGAAWDSGSGCRLRRQLEARVRRSQGARHRAQDPMGCRCGLKATCFP